MCTADFAYDVFLSYSSKDKVVVLPLAEKLKSSGLRVWIDAWEIRAGDNIPAKIEQGLDRSHVLALCMSANAFGSDWTALESQTFRFRDPLNTERRFIPLRLDDAEPKGSLIQFSYVDWRKVGDETQYRRLLQACQPPERSASEDEVEVSGLEERVFPLEDGEASYSLCLTPDCKLALAGSGEGRLRLWDINSCRLLRMFKGQHGDGSLDNSIVWSVAFSSDGKRALSGGEDGMVMLWDVESGQPLHVLTELQGILHCVAFSQDGFHVIWAGDDKTVTLWDLATERVLQYLEGDTGGLRCVAFSFDGKRVLSGGKDTTVRLWDVQNGRELRVLEGHTDNVLSLAFSPDGKHALSGSMDHTVRLWDLQNGRSLEILRHIKAVHRVTFSQDGRYGFSADFAGVVRAWNLRETIESAAHSGSQSSTPVDEVQYTNAKVLFVGESGSGKTGLTERLVHNRPPQRGPSTAGTWSTQWPIGDLPQEPGFEREVWLWDFGGQADQRLIHQLYLDHTAFVLLMFNADRESIVPGLREWQQALARSMARNTPTLLVAGRTDVGLRFDRDKVRAFAKVVQSTPMRCSWHRPCRITASRYVACSPQTLIALFVIDYRVDVLFDV
jgi:GTPase SAR1 family protein